MINVPSMMYKSASSEDIADLEQFANTLESVFGQKTAGAPVPESLGRSMLRAAGTGLAIGVGTAGAGVLGLGAAKGLEGAYNRLTFKRDLNKILDVHPDLKEHSERDINLAYNSIRRLNPNFAKDPLVGGSLLGQVLRNRDTRDPSKAPKVELGVAKELADVYGKRRPSELSQALSGGMSAGFGKAMSPRQAS